MRKGRIGFHTQLAVPALAAFVILFAVPVLAVLCKASPARLVEYLGDPYMLKVLGFTLRQAMLSTVISVVVGLPGAWVLARHDFRGKGLLRAVYSIPFVLPSILAVLGFVVFYGNSGYLNRLLCLVFGLDEAPLQILYSGKAILMAHAFYNFPVIAILVGDYWRNLDPRLESASSLMGAGRARTFVSVTMPRLLPSVASAASLVFLYCFTSFAVILVLGGGPAYTTTEVEIYRLARTTLDTEGAATLAVMSLSVACVVLGLHSLFESRAARDREQFYEGKAPVVRGRGARAFRTVYVAASLVFILCPIVSIVVKGFGAWGKVLAMDSVRQAALQGSVRALLAAVFSVMCAVCMAGFIRTSRSRVLPVVLMLPMAVSSVITGLGYHILRSVLGAGVGEAMLVVTHGTLAMPFALKTVLPSCRRIPANVVDSSRLLGEDEEGTFRRVELPLMGRAALSAFAFSFSLSMGELNATLMVGGPNAKSLSVAIYRLVSTYDYQSACVVGTILMLICFLAFLASGATGRRKDV